MNCFCSGLDARYGLRVSNKPPSRLLIGALTHVKLCPGITTGVTQMYAEDEYDQFPGLGHVVPPQRLAGLVQHAAGRGAHVQQAVVLLHEVERDRGVGGHVGQHRRYHDQEVLEQVGVLDDPPVRLPGPEFDEVTVELEDYGAVADDEADLAGPRLQQALDDRRLEYSNHNLRG